MHSESSKPLSRLSPFLLDKVLEDDVGETFSAGEMSSEDLLVDINAKQQSFVFLARNEVEDYKCIVSLHRKLSPNSRSYFRG